MIDDREEKRPLKEDLRALAQSPRELWIVYAAKFLESIGLFSLLFTLVLWLSKDFGYDDVAAGWWAGTFSTILTVLTFFVGFVADAWGVRRTLLVAFAASMVARGLMGFAPSRPFAIAGLLVLALGTAAGVPVLNTAVRRYTTKKSRAFGFSIYYVIMNIGAAAAGFVVDAARSMFKDPVTGQLVTRQMNVPLLGTITTSAYRTVFLIGFGCAIASFLIALAIRPGIEADAEEEPAAPSDAKGPIAIALEVIREKAFWRFMLFIGLLVMVKLIFQHYHFTWPKYATRELGQDFPIGRFFAINPILITFLVPLATAFTRHRSAFKTIVVGSFISAASVFFLVLGASWTTNLLMIGFLSIGEALWSPRLYEYTATIAPRGRESSYMGLSALPMFFAKMAVGPLSGYLLARYVPEHGERHSGTMWLIIGLMTLAGPIAIVLLRGVIEGQRAKAVAPAAQTEVATS